VNQTDKKLISLPFGAFIDRLKALGFLITINHYLRIKEVLSRPMAGRTLEHIKYITCPLFATSEEQQKLYYRTFDEFFAPFDISIRSAQWTPRAPSVKFFFSKINTIIKKWSYLLSGIIIFLVIMIVLLHHYDTNQMLKYCVLISLSLILILVEFYQYNHQKKMVLQKKDFKTLPLYQVRVPIRVPQQSINFLKTKQFYAIARHLRNPLYTGILQLDVIQTIEKTIESYGFPQLQYSQLTRPPEYLLLIDMPNYQNKFTHYMAQLVDAFGKEGVFITRYFYKEYPLVCFQDIHSQYHYLKDIQHKYKDCRLIIIGTSDVFWDPVTGQPDHCLSIFNYWPERALMTPRPFNQWGYHEYEIMNYFQLFPATLEGFEQLSIHFDISSKCRNRFYQSECAYGQPIAIDEKDCDKIEQSINNASTFQWLCACAVYPELNWNLTLYLGELIIKDTVHEKQLLTLLRLPWFQTGKIPSNVRYKLIQRLSKEKISLITQGILKKIEKNPPPKDEFVYDTFRFNLSIQSWMLCKKDKKLQRIVQDALYKHQNTLLYEGKFKQFFLKLYMILFDIKDFMRLMFVFGLAVLIMLIALF